MSREWPLAFQQHLGENQDGQCPGADSRKQDLAKVTVLDPSVPHPYRGFGIELIGPIDMDYRRSVSLMNVVSGSCYEAGRLLPYLNSNHYMKFIKNL